MEVVIVNKDISKTHQNNVLHVKQDAKNVNLQLHVNLINVIQKIISYMLNKLKSVYVRMGFIQMRKKENVSLVKQIAKLALMGINVQHVMKQEEAQMPKVNVYVQMDIIQ